MAIVANQQQQDAHSLLRNVFRSFGLTESSLATWALEQLIMGSSIDQILLELETRPEYERAFPEIKARREQAARTGVQLEPLSPAEILTYRTEARALMHSFGVPVNMYQQNSDFFDLIVGDVSLTELQARLEIAENRVRHAPPEVRDVFSQIFGQGVGGTDQALFAFMIDPDNAMPRLEEMARTAEALGAARRYGFDAFAPGEDPSMNRLRDYPMTYDQYAQGFSELDRVRSLFDETLYESDWDWSDEGVEAAFGLRGGAAEALERRGESRAAETRGRSTAGAVESGVAGLGSAGRI